MSLGKPIILRFGFAQRTKRYDFSFRLLVSTSLNEQMNKSKKAMSSRRGLFITLTNKSKLSMNR